MGSGFVTSRPRSYIRRGRITQSQRDALTLGAGRLLQPTTLFDQSKIFGRSDAKLCVEIGFGMGENLLQVAVQHQNIDFVGIEVHAPGIGKVLGEALRSKLNNIGLYQADAIDVLHHCIEPESVDWFFVLFPDPWPKFRHHKRRLFQSHFVDLLHRALLPGGCVWFATDWDQYALQVASLFAQNEQWLSRQLESCFDFVKRVDTRFERKGLAEKRKVTDCIWQKL